jgi:hypothetical protein
MQITFLILANINNSIKLFSKYYAVSVLKQSINKLYSIPYRKVLVGRFDGFESSGNRFDIF